MIRRNSDAACIRILRLKTEAKISARVVKDMIISGLDFPGGGWEMEII